MGELARWLSKALAVAPGLVVSTAVTSMIGSTLPPVAGSALFVGGLITVTVLLLGWGESAAARLLLMSRPARADELSLLAPALTMLCRVGLGPPLVKVRVSEGDSAIAVGGIGRRTVVVSSGLLESVADHSLPQEQAAAVIGHAAAVIRGGLVRSDTAIAFWSLPWQLLRAVCMTVASVGRRLPLASLAWQLRVVVVAIAVLQSLQLRRPWLAAVIGVLGAVSYAMPVWERRWQRVMLEAGDRGLVDAGLALPLAAFLRRCPATPAIRARLRSLCSPVRRARPIGLVVAR